MDYMLSANIMDDLNQTMFLAFAFAFPDAQFLVYFIIPVKAKWLSIVYLLMDGYMFVRYLMSGYYYSAAVILVLLLNFLSSILWDVVLLRQSRRTIRRRERWNIRKNSTHTGKCTKASLCDLWQNGCGLSAVRVPLLLQM